MITTTATSPTIIAARPASPTLGMTVLTPATITSTAIIAGRPRTCGPKA
jgi:hypothetical protein